MSTHQPFTLQFDPEANRDAFVGMTLQGLDGVVGTVHLDGGGSYIGYEILGPVDRNNNVVFIQPWYGEGAAIPVPLAIIVGFSVS